MVKAYIASTVFPSDRSAIDIPIEINFPTVTGAFDNALPISNDINNSVIRVVEALNPTAGQAVPLDNATTPVQSTAPRVVDTPIAQALPTALTPQPMAVTPADTAVTIDPTIAATRPTTVVPSTGIVQTDTAMTDPALAVAPAIAATRPAMAAPITGTTPADTAVTVTPTAPAAAPAPTTVVSSTETAATQRRIPRGLTIARPAAAALRASPVFAARESAATPAATSTTSTTPATQATGGFYTAADTPVVVDIPGLARTST